MKKKNTNKYKRKKMEQLNATYNTNINEDNESKKEKTVTFDVDISVNKIDNEDNGENVKIPINKTKKHKKLMSKKVNKLISRHKSAKNTSIYGSNFSSFFQKNFARNSSFVLSNSCNSPLIQ